MGTDVGKVIDAIDKIRPIIDLLDSMSSALRCERFDDAPIREGVCVALGMGSERLQVAIELLYDCKGRKNMPPS